MPVPEPTAAYLTGMPSLISKLLIQLAIRGATSVEPAPVRPAAEAVAVVADAVPPPPRKPRSAGQAAYCGAMRSPFRGLTPQACPQRFTKVCQFRERLK